MSKITTNEEAERPQSILPFDIESLTQGIRIRPADFARICGVSKQAVSNWIKIGKITLFPDGTLDPRKAAQQVINNTAPGRLRARIFKLSFDEAAQNRAKIKSLQGLLAAQQEWIDQFKLFENSIQYLLYRDAPNFAAVSPKNRSEMIARLFEQAVEEANKNSE